MNDDIRATRVRPLFRVFAGVLVIVCLPIVALQWIQPQRNWHFAIAGLLFVLLFAYTAVVGRGPSFLR
jgi:hypothetical protein